jgi:hypothetical protein
MPAFCATVTVADASAKVLVDAEDVVAVCEAVERSEPPPHAASAKDTESADKSLLDVDIRLIIVVIPACFRPWISPH